MQSLIQPEADEYPEISKGGSHGRAEFKGKTVIIAGGAKNLGGLLARDFAEHGAGAIAIHYNREADKSQADETLAAIKAAGAEAVRVPGGPHLRCRHGKAVQRC